MANIAVALGDGYEDSEFTVPFEHLSKTGHQLTIFGDQENQTVQGKRGQSEAVIETTAADIQPEDFDALVIPGGYAPDRLRMNADIVNFVKRFTNSGKPVAAICHGPQLLIEAGVVTDATLTSWPSVKTDLINAGARWVDQEVVIDGNLITSRKPGDLDAFCETLDNTLAAAA